jgi:uncharacterized membrane protein
MAERFARRDRTDRLDQPNAPRRGLRISYDPEAFGRLTERIARFLGTGRYLIIQTILVIFWIGENTIPGLPHFDPYAFLFLTLILSLQAAYSAPLILLAQNRQDDRDRVNLEEDRGQARQALADTEYLAREMAAIRLALGDVVTRDFLRSELQRLDRAEDRDKGKDRDRDKDREKDRDKERARAERAAKRQATNGAATADVEPI